MEILDIRNIEYKKIKSLKISFKTFYFEKGDLGGFSNLPY